jgi:hypothetical protein
MINFIAEIVGYVLVDIIFYNLFFPKSFYQGLMAWCLLLATLFVGYNIIIFMAQNGFIKPCVEGVDAFCVKRM